jgi:polygalacturonase
MSKLLTTKYFWPHFVFLTDSSTNVRIQDNYIVSGDDCIAIKSGRDKYGIKFGKPSQKIIIRRLTCISPDSAMTALGSEMSGGIQDAKFNNTDRVEDNSLLPQGLMFFSIFSG